jgi:hypothetical protein
VHGQAEQDEPGVEHHQPSRDPHSTATLSSAVASAISASPPADAAVDRASSIHPSIAGLPDDRAASTASSTSDVAAASRPSAVTDGCGPEQYGEVLAGPERAGGGPGALGVPGGVGVSVDEELGAGEAGDQRVR